jgi:hypothetical protein
MYWYVLIVTADGATQRIAATSPGNAQDIFEQAVKQPSTVYAHHGEILSERTNWYCRKD